MKSFVVARTGSGRPSLMHLTDTNILVTRCGLIMRGWSRAYTNTPIPAILCKKCAKKVNL
jgi:hypothetical protein